jgi:Peptidase inhibitor family I36
MSMSRRIAVTTAAFAVAAGGLVLGANPAGAAFSDCHTNQFCLWSGENGTGTLLFAGDGSAMHDNPTYWDSPALRANPHPRSSSNRTLGTFCTYDADKKLTNKLGRGDTPLLQIQTARWVKIC